MKTKNRVTLRAIFCMVFVLPPLLLFAAFYPFDRDRVVSSKDVSNIVQPGCPGLVVEDVTIDEMVVLKSRVHGAKGPLITFHPKDRTLKRFREDGWMCGHETVLWYMQVKEICETTDALIVDVGANVGWFSILAGFWGCRVIAFEPQPQLIPAIRNSILINGLQDKVTLHHCAVGDFAVGEKVQIEMSEELPGLMSFQNDNYADQEKVEHHPVEVPSCRLDQYIKEDVLLLKVDVEGFLYTVLKSMKGIEGKHAIDHYVLEIKWKREPEIVEAFLQNRVDAGYVVETYMEDYVAHFDPSQLTMSFVAPEPVTASNFRANHEDYWVHKK